MLKGINHPGLRPLHLVNGKTTMKKQINVRWAIFSKGFDSGETPESAIRATAEAIRFAQDKIENNEAMVATVFTTEDRPAGRNCFFSDEEVLFQAIKGE